MDANGQSHRRRRPQIIEEESPAQESSLEEENALEWENGPKKQRILEQRRVKHKDWILFLACFAAYLVLSLLCDYDLNELLNELSGFSGSPMLPYLPVPVYCIPPMFAIVFLAQKKQRACIVMCSVDVLVQLFRICAFLLFIDVDGISIIFLLIGFSMHLCAMAALIYYAATQTNNWTPARICIALSMLGIGSVLLTIFWWAWPISECLFFFMLAAGFRIFVPVKRESKAPQTPENDYLTQYKRQNRI